MRSEIPDDSNDPAPSPSRSGRAQRPAGGLPLRVADFGSLAEALDYAARSDETMAYHRARGGCEHRLTYAAVRDQALRLAAALYGLGLRRGDQVGVIAETHPDFVSAFFACQYGGFVAVPLPVMSGLGSQDGYEHLLARIFSESTIQAVSSPAWLHETLRRAGAAGLPDGRVFTASDLLSRSDAERAPSPLGPDEISHIQFSSGSTRLPLGVVISQRAVMANTRSIARHGIRVRPGDRVASWLPFYHDMGLVGHCLVPVVCQMSVDFLPSSDFARRPLRWLEMISAEGATISFSPDFGYDVCSRVVRGTPPEGLDLSRWRVAGIGGDMVKPESLARFAATFAPCGFDPAAFLPSYGLAESTLAFSFEVAGAGIVTDRIDRGLMTTESVARPVTRAVPDRSARVFASCGRPLPGHRVEIRDPSGARVADRHLGQVFVTGPSLMDGYHANPGATARCIGEDGWLDTGDIGYLADGRLYITGRHKDMIVVKGRNIWPQDLEWHVEREVAGLRRGDAAAFGHLAEDGEEIAVILVQCRKSDPRECDRLAREAASAVRRNSGIACRVETIPPRSLPFTTSGKLMRSKAKQMWLAGRWSHTAERSPADPALDSRQPVQAA